MNETNNRLNHLIFVQPIKEEIQNPTRGKTKSQWEISRRFSKLYDGKIVIFFNQYCNGSIFDYKTYSKSRP